MPTVVQVLGRDGVVVEVTRAMLRRFADDEIELVDDRVLPVPPLAVGARLVVQRVVPGDGLRTQQAEVAAVAGDGTRRLRVTGPAQRWQRRGHVRVDTGPLAVTVARPSGAHARRGSADDVSAGGLGVWVPEVPWDLGATVRVSFELPRGDDVMPVDQRARVVRVTPGAAGDGVTALGLSFTSVPPALEQRLTQWVFQQEARLARERRG